ncbi:DoxX family membrane protein [Muricauda sp. SCSIO 64092]|uniref:DoxX family membrane protein n=1 Tax=Allomuricauda sp. SCSIO 64092 TaxID=2908842 RepID=UPI00131CF8E8|nr:DoxX family membrane protein [Muricauda sp. SCSIO 64092]UOY07341.1 DoxX family membrane protein [Muricauda sp. SCSIO 64092]
MEKKSKIEISVIILRVLIGWHFLYEGIVKLYNPDWTAFGYLASAQGPFKSVFSALANESVIGWVDTLNMAALMVVGITLLLGIFEKMGAIVGIGLLAMYYLSHPPFPGLTQLNVEGNYWLVNKNLIEMAALLLLYHFPTGYRFGIKNLRKHKTVAQ